MDKVFLTGANGFVGLNIAERLTSRGYQVHAYVRPQSKSLYLERLPVKIFRGELDDQPAMRAAMAGCRYVIHTAGNTSTYQTDLPQLIKTNIEGTRAVVETALRNSVERLVFTSTTSTIGACNDRNFQAQEHQPISGFRAGNPYGKTKTNAEEIVLAAQSRGMATIILNLAEVIGAYDHNLQWGRLVLAVAYDQVPFIPPGGGTFCSARCAADAHVNALTRGNSGEKYIIGGVHADFCAFIDQIGAQLGQQFRAPAKSYLWLLLNARIYTKLPRLYKNPPLVDPYRLRVFGGHYYFDSSKARNELGYEVASLENMLAECISWYRENGFIQ
jgi:dihydroflavonol-4-reductase